MRIKMTVHIGGFRNGAEWPAAGFCWDVPDEEAADLILAGYAKEATDEDPDHPGTAEWEPDAAADGDPAGARQFRIAFANVDAAGIGNLIDRLARWRA